MKKILYIILALGFATTAYAAAPVTFPINGGTGTSTKPTLGQVLVGQSNSTYAPQATSTLGLQAALSGGTTNALTYWTSASALGATTTPTVIAINMSSSTATSTLAGGVKIPQLQWGGIFTNQYPITADASGNLTRFSNIWLDTGISTPGIHITPGKQLFAGSINTGSLDSSGGTMQITAEGSGINVTDSLKAQSFQDTGAFYDNTNSSGAAGSVLQSNGSGVNWVATSSLGLSSSASSSQTFGYKYVTASTTAGRITFYTPTATSTYSAGCTVNITAIVTDVAKCQLTYTDETNTVVTEDFFPMGLTSASLSTTGHADYPQISLFRAAANKSITVQLVLTTSIGSITYNAGGIIQQVSPN